MRRVFSTVSRIISAVLRRKRRPPAAPEPRTAPKREPAKTQFTTIMIDDRG